MPRGAIAIWAWAISIVVTWALVALDLGHPIWMQQHSRDLTAYGVFEGRTLRWGESWRLFASQWLHVKFPHMLFNAGVIGLVGAAMTRQLAWPLVLALGLVGGAVGQLTAALLQPDAYISGASQAYLALCGAGLLVVDRMSLGWWAAVVGVIVSVGLDLFVSGHAGIKPGHITSFATGLAAGAGLLVLRRRGPRQAIVRRA